MSDFESYHKPEPSNNAESLDAFLNDEQVSSSEISIEEAKARKDKLKADEAESIKEDEKREAEILAEIEALDDTDITDSKAREKAQKKLDALGKEYNDLDNDDITQASNERVIRNSPDSLGGNETIQKLSTSNLDNDFESADTTLTLFSTLNDNLPNWERVIGGSGDITENNERGHVVREFATELIKATGETSIRPDNTYIFTRACEALSILTNHYNVPLKADLFHDDGKCNIKAIKAFAQANKEILTDPNIELSDGTNILDIEDSLALIEIEKKIEES